MTACDGEAKSVIGLPKLLRSLATLVTHCLSLSPGMGRYCSTFLFSLCFAPCALVSAHEVVGL